MTDLRLPSVIRLSLGHWQQGLLVLMDGIALALGWKFADRLALKEPSDFVRIWSLGDPIGLFWLMLLIYLTLSMAAGLYRYGDEWQDSGKHFKTISLAYLVLLLLTFLTRTADGLPRSMFVLAWLLSLGLLLLNRTILKQAKVFLHQREQALTPILLVADPDEQEFIRLGWQGCSGYRVKLALTELQLQDLPATLLLDRIRHLGIQEIHVSETLYQCMGAAELWQLRGFGYLVRIVPGHLKPVHPHVRMRTLSGIPTMEFAPPVLTGVDFYIKRVFDFTLAALLLLLLSPVFGVISALIIWDDPGPVFYGGSRPGLGGHVFRMWKFRTMVVEAERLQAQLEAHNENPDGILFKIKSDPRVTRIGNFLRRTSLDELPQLWNVLRGEMSLVGPRPLPVRDVERFQPWHHARHEVLPGMTGLWQVRGRGDYVNFDEAIIYDLDYIERWSLWLDIQLLWETIWVVLRGKGAY